MLGRRLPRLHEREHLDLVELVHPEDALGVLAGRARLAAEAGGEAGVAPRQLVAGQDRAGVERGQRHLRGAGQVEVVLGDAVDLLLGVGQEACAEQRVLAYEHRRDHRHEALLLEQGEHPLHQRELEPHDRPLQVGEARAGHPGAGLHVHEVAEEVEVVARRWRPPRRPRAAPRPPAGQLGSGRLGSAASAACAAPRRCAARRPAPSRDRRHRAPRRSPPTRPRRSAEGRRSAWTPRSFAGAAPRAQEARRAGARPARAPRRAAPGPRRGARARRAPVGGRRGSDGDRARAGPRGWRPGPTRSRPRRRSRRRSTWRGSRRPARRPCRPRCWPA